MPDERSHLSLANHNQELLDRLIPDVGQFPDWVATIAFYKALHVVEAVFACQRPIRHGVDHFAREQILKSASIYDSIYQHYRVLYAASMVARYMQNDTTDFTRYQTPEQVVNELLRHRLHRIEQSAVRKLAHPDLLVRITPRLAAVVAPDPPEPT